MTITTYTDKEIALKAQLAAMTAERDEYQQAADKMAWDHKVERDTLQKRVAELEAEKLRLCGEVSNRNMRALEGDKAQAAFEQIYLESEQLRQQLAEAQALIEASRIKLPKPAIETTAFSRDSSTQTYYSEEQLKQYGDDRAREAMEMAAKEAERMTMYTGGRQEAPAHETVWHAARAIRALAKEIK